MGPWTEVRSVHGRQLGMGIDRSRNLLPRLELGPHGGDRWPKHKGDDQGLRALSYKGSIRSQTSQGLSSRRGCVSVKRTIMQRICYCKYKPNPVRF